MQAGRELDALVAEKVMGWKWLERDEFNEYRHLTPNGQKIQVAVPRYSTDIAAAWQIVEKIKFMQPGWEIYGLKPDHLQKFTIEYNGFGWRAGWAPVKLDGNMTIEAEAEAAPHAICLAALRAVGVEV